MTPPKQKLFIDRPFCTQEVKAISMVFADSVPYVTKLLPYYDVQKNEIKASKAKMTEDFLILQKELRELTSDKVDHLRTSFNTSLI